MKKIIFLLISIFILNSCKDVPVIPLNITKTLSLVKQKKVIDKGYGYSALKDSLLILIAYSDPEEKFIHIYDTSFNFKLSIGNKGKLFSEFNMPELYNNINPPNDSFIHLFDINLLQEKKFIPQNFLTNSNTEEEIKGKYLPTKLYFTNNLNLLNDSLIVGQSIEMNKGIYFLYNKNSKEMNWVKFNHKFKYPDKKYEDYSYLNSICAHPIQKKIMVAYRYFDLIQLYDDKGKLLKELCFSKIQKPLLSSMSSCMAPEASFYNLSICGTNEYCYILRANKTGIELQHGEKGLLGQLIVVDWQGNIKNIYQCPALLYSVVIDSNNTYIYATVKDYNDLEYCYIQKYKL